MKTVLALIPVALILAGCVKPAGDDIRIGQQIGVGRVTAAPAVPVRTAPAARTTQARPAPAPSRQTASASPAPATSTAATAPSSVMTINDAPTYNGGSTSGDPVLIKLN